MVDGGHTPINPDDSKTDATGSNNTPDTASTLPTSTNKRSSKVTGKYKDRVVKYYHFSNSDIAHIKAANILSTLSFGIGSWLITLYIDFNKEIALNERAELDFLTNVTDSLYVGWIICWSVALLAMFWQGKEIYNIKIEHGDMGMQEKFIAFINSIRNWGKN